MNLSTAPWTCFLCLLAVAPFPLEDRVQRWERAHHEPISATSLSREDYLRVAEGVVRYFVRRQSDEGRIIDPYEKRERQYATPAFACAAAVLAERGRKDLLAPAIRAMDAATQDLIAGNAADRHGDFYTVLLMHAYEALHALAPPESVRQWDEWLASLEPQKSYRDTGPNAHNWNVVAISGEYLHAKAGLGREAAEQFIAEYLPRQLKLFTPFGMYRDPHDPIAYDLFPRLWLTDMLFHGYRGVESQRLDDLLRRGAWTSLFMQSPTGEMPAGGRSGAHQWNEAQQAATSEMMARLYKASGRPHAAAAFKRGARLSLESVRRWLRPTGELWIVKNHYDPALRFGYENYSFHSQYNLLAAAMLAMAFVHADESIAEGPAPADTGGFVVPLEGAFHKVIANCGGLYVEVELDAYPNYQSTGIIRVHRRGLPPAFPLPDAVTRQAAYNTGKSKPSQNLALGPEWKSDGAWHRLAGITGVIPAVRVLEETAQTVRFSVEWPEQVRETITLTPDRLTVEDEALGPAQEMAVLIPFLTDAGPNPVRYRVLTPGAGPLVRLNVQEPNRYGMLDAYRSAVPGNHIRYEIAP